MSQRGGLENWLNETICMASYWSGCTTSLAWITKTKLNKWNTKYTFMHLLTDESNELFKLIWLVCCGEEEEIEKTRIDEEERKNKKKETQP